MMPKKQCTYSGTSYLYTMDIKDVHIKENAWIAKIAAHKLKSVQVAITFGNTIYLHNISKENFLLQSSWVRHELQHVAQFKKYGLLRFAYMYVRESIKHGYHDNKWEIEARQMENEA